MGDQFFVEALPLFVQDRKELLIIHIVGAMSHQNDNIDVFFKRLMSKALPNKAFYSVSAVS